MQFAKAQRNSYEIYAGSRQITTSGNPGTGSGIYMAVTDSAGVIGNGGIVGGVPVAFIGQVTTKIEGCAQEGQYVERNSLNSSDISTKRSSVADIVPSGNNDGKGKAVNPEDLKGFGELKKVIGTAWETGCGQVRMAVGVK